MANSVATKAHFPLSSRPCSKLFLGAAIAVLMLLATLAYSQETTEGQNIPPSHYLKVYWLAKDGTVNFMVVDDDNKYRVYECEIHGRTMRKCTIPPHTYEVTDFSQAALPQEPAKARTLYYDAGGNFGEATSIRDLPLNESIIHALHNPFGREDR